MREAADSYALANSLSVSSKNDLRNESTTGVEHHCCEVCILEGDLLKGGLHVVGVGMVRADIEALISLMTGPRFADYGQTDIEGLVGVQGMRGDLERMYCAWLTPAMIRKGLVAILAPTFVTYRRVYTG